MYQLLLVFKRNVKDNTLVCIGGVSTHGNWIQEDVEIIKLRFPTETIINLTQYASLEEVYVTNTELKCIKSTLQLKFKYSSIQKNAR